MVLTAVPWPCCMVLCAQERRRNKDAIIRQLSLRATLSGGGGVGGGVVIQINRSRLCHYTPATRAPQRSKSGILFSNSNVSLIIER